MKEPEYDFNIGRPEEGITTYDINGRDLRANLDLTLVLTERSGEPSRLEMMTVNVYGIMDQVAVESPDVIGLREIFNFYARPLLGCAYPFDPALSEKVPVGERRPIAPTTPLQGKPAKMYLH